METNPFIPDEERERNLKNFTHGSLVVVDEVQYCWPSAGTKLTEDIKHLTMHRKYGLDFVLITQSPHLIHKDVLAVVDRHIHIRSAWFGRHMFEWPEYCPTPKAMSSKLQATKKRFKLPKQAFGTYRSASVHTKQKKSLPAGIYFFPLLLLLLPIMAYRTYSGVFNKEKTEATLEQIAQEKPLPQGPSLPSPVSYPVVPAVPVPVFGIPVVSNQVDWTKVSACLSSKTQCICYGTSSERLVIPPDTCRLAVKHGWPGKSSATVATNL